MAPENPSRGISWAALESAAPELARDGRALLRRGGGAEEGLLATVRGDAPPRIHPVSVGIVDGRILVFVLPSPKRSDLEIDGRYALHAHQDAAAPSEFSVRGRARHIRDTAARAAAASVWPFEVDDSYALFELPIESAVIGRRPTADDWPPRYEAWPGKPRSPSA